MSKGTLLTNNWLMPGIMLLVFSPCLYCDVTDSWMMRNKWHRIIKHEFAA